MKSSRPKVAIYLRISHDPSGAQVGVTRQRKDCRAIANLRWPDHEIVEFVDNDISAYTGKRRPAYDQMLESGAATIVAWNLDRLLRQPRELETLIDLGIPIVTAQGDLDLTTHDGQLQARILVAVAKKSSDDSSRRIKRAHKERAEKGLFHGGRYVPFPYVKGEHAGELVVGTGASTVLAVARAVVEGHTLASAIRQHVDGATGGDTRQRLVDGRLQSTAKGVGSAAPRTREAWRLILTGPTIRGFNSTWQPAAWPAIIDEELGASLTRALAKKSRSRPNKKWPLSAVARCGKCGGKLYGTVNRGYSAYACRVVGCHGVCVDSQQLEDLVEGALREATIVVPAERRVTRDLVAERRLEQLTLDYARGVEGVTRAVLDAARRAFREVKPPPRPPVVFPRAQRSENEQREEVSIFGRLHALESVVVLPIGKGGRFDPGRVQLNWRQ